MEDDSLIQMIWDLKCAAAPKCASCGGSVYSHDTYTRIGPYLFCEECESRKHRLYSCDLEFEF